MATKFENRKWKLDPEALEHVSCNLCRADDTDEVSIEFGLRVVRCRHCGLVYVNPRPDAAQLQRYYETYYAPESADAWRVAMARLVDCDLDRIRKLRLPAHADGGRPRVLDAGCGYGFLPKRLQDEGWEAHGCDLSETAVDYAKRELGVEVDHGDFNEIPYEPGSFDLVTASCLLEHVADPRRIIEHSFELLKPGGVLAVRVPNFDFLKVFPWLGRRMPFLKPLVLALRMDEVEEESVFYGLIPPAHLYGPTPRTMRRLFEDCGFEFLALHTDSMVSRGNLLNWTVDTLFTQGARALRGLTGGRVERSVLFSLYARKPEALDSGDGVAA